MATWHQQRAAVPLFHPTKWTVVIDPPNQCTSVSRFDTAKLANDYWATLGKDRGAYVVPPAHAGR
jgi:hypothetical protein